MKQEDKELLLKDLYARLPYGVKVSIGLDRMNNYIEPEAENILTLYYINPQRLECVFKECWWTAYIGAIKPYLRSLSSMTEEELNELRNYTGLLYDNLDLASFQNGTYKCLDFYLSEIPADVVIKVFDWLHMHHFDYRGLIPKGLALEAPEGMYNTKN